MTKRSLYTKLIVEPETNERKNFSMWMMFGGAITFTLFAAASLYLVRDYPDWAFWLGIAAHIQIITIMTGYIAQLVKRRIVAGKDGVTIEDTSSTETITTESTSHKEG